MATRRTLMLSLAALLGMAVPRPAIADDTDLLNRVTPAPNVLIILDTSQSMTWYGFSGESALTRGDEYPGYSVDRTPMARMALAKSVLSTVVDSYFNYLRLGLASYAEGGTPANPNASVRIKRYHYYCTRRAAYCTDSAGAPQGRQYLFFTPPTSSLATGASTTEWNNLQLWVNNANLNMPRQNTFTVRWDLDPGVSPNPRMNTINHGGSAPTPARTYCVWDVVVRLYNRDGTLQNGYPRSTTEERGQAPCQPNGTTGTITQTEAFANRASGEDPNPYKYNVTQSWSGFALYGASNRVAGYDTNFGPGWTDFTRAYTYNGNTRIVPANPGTPGGPPTYSWTYWYKGTCTDGCTGSLTTYATTGEAASQNPVLPSPRPVGVTRTYTWSGNNYEMNPPAAENTCALGTGITILVDVGGAPDKDSLKNYLGTGPDKTKELHGANNYTPLATALDTARAYFLDDDGVVQDDLQKDCRHNYLILITDGGESCPLVPVTGPGSPGDKAAALLNAPVNDFGGVPTFVVALDGASLKPDERTVLADIAAKGSVSGTGTYYSASSLASLLSALNAIIGSILTEQYSFVNPVVPALRNQDNLMLLQASFKTPPPPDPVTGLPDPNTPLWPGILAAYPMDSQGQVTITDQQISATPLWEAGALLANRASSTRVIKTVVGGSLVDFTKSPANPALQAALNMTIDVDGDSDVDNQDADKVIDTVRGPTNPGNKGFLGDIFHSVPIVVGPPTPTYADRTFDPANPTQLLSLSAAPDTFATFRSAKGTRQRLALVGANEGMLHAFNAGTFDSLQGKYNTGDGSEVWGFIPPQMLPNLQYLAVNQGHHYYVDASPRVADVWLDGVPNDGTPGSADGVKATNEWHTVLVGGFRQGGTGLYALDITDTTNPAFLWTYATTGQSWSEPAFGKVKVQFAGRLVDRWVVFVGDGYDPAGTNGRMVHAIDVQTGKALWQFATTSPVAAGPLAVDVNSDGYVDRVYVGTVGGDLLRLDVSAVGKSALGGNVDPAGGVMVATCPLATPNCWSGGVFFAAGPAQPFYTKATAAFDPDGNLWVFVGSGDRSNPMLVPGTANRAYGIKDPYPSVIIPLTEANLTDMTGTNTLDPSAVTGSGWFIQFRSGEKDWAETALVFNSQVFFTTFMPGSSGCGDVGSGSIYMVYYLTGGGVSDTALFTADPPQPSSRVFEVNAGATSRPVVTTGAQGSNAVVYMGNSNMLTLQPPFSAPPSIRSVLYWRRVLP